MRDLVQALLMYGVVPLWLAMGFVDWLCHRAADIEHTSGPKESLLHLAQFGEVGVGMLALLLLEVTPGLFALLLLCALLHEATAIWDVRYANETRRVGPAEQHVHGVLEGLPFAAIALLAVAWWPEFAGLADPGRWLDFGWKAVPLPAAYLVAVLAGAALFGALPYAEELLRTLRASRRGR